MCLALLCLALSTVGYAQVSAYLAPPANYELDTTFITRMNYIFARLEKQRVPHGLLLDYSIETADLRSYSGVLTDSNKVHAGTVADIYLTLAMSALHSNAGQWQHPDYIDSLWFTQRQAGIVTLRGLYYQYARFKDNALSGSLVRVSGEQIYDRYVLGQWRNPYQTERVFAMTPSVMQYRGLSFQVRFPANLWHTNQAGSISAYAVDLGDGLGYRPIAKDQTLSVSYAVAGTKVWKFRLTLTNGTQLYSHSEVEVSEGPASTVPTGGMAGRFLSPAQAITATEAFQGQFASGWMTIDYADAGRVLDNPLIVVEGFDSGHILNPESQFGNTDFDSFRRQILNSQSGNLIDILQSDFQQYDIVYVDWRRGTDFLQRNGLLLEAVIRWVNANKTGTTPNVVLGQSMGGVIARWALRDMEQKGQSHQTRLCISYDSPHLGANVPMAYQHAGRHASSLYTKSAIPTIIFAYNNVVRTINTHIALLNAIRGMDIGFLATAPSNSTIYGGLNMMDVPAARQMLINRINQNNQIDNTAHDTWQTELRQKGYPLQCRNVTMSNGSECGFGQNYNPNAFLLNINGKLNTRFLGDVLSPLAFPLLTAITFKPQFLLGIIPGRSDMKCEFVCKAQPENQSTLLYKGKITYTKKVLWLVPVTVNVTNKSYNANPTILPIDNTPGGLIDTRVNLQSTESKNWLIKYNIQASNIPNFNYIPTVSALDLGGGNTPLTLADYRAAYNGANPPPAPKNTPFANFITAFNQIQTSDGKFNENEFHLRIDSRNGNWLAAELNDVPETANCSAICPTTLTFTGANALCNSAGVYTIEGAPANAVYSWSITPVPNTVVNLLTNGKTATLTRIGNNSGTIQLQVLVVLNDCATVLTKQINVSDFTFSAGLVDYAIYEQGTQYPICPGYHTLGFQTAFPYQSVTWQYPPELTQVYSNGEYLDFNLPYEVNGGIYIAAIVNHSCGSSVFSFNLYRDPFGLPCVTYLTYPNPTTEELNIEETSPESVTQTATTTHEVSKKGFEAELYNRYQQKVLSAKTQEKSLKMNLKHLQADVYYLRIISATGVENKRIVVNK